MLQSNTATFELSELKLVLKPGLEYKLRQGKYEQWYLVEDPLRASFFRVGQAEYLLMSQLNGSRTLATAVAHVCTLMGASALSEYEALAFCRWLLDTGLAVTDASSSAQRIQERKDKAEARKLLQKVNPVSVRFNLFNPDRLLQQATHFLGWLVSWPALFVWLTVCAYAACLLAYDWQRFISDAALAFSRDNWIWMAASWLGLKLVHELAHGICCKKFGGEVNRCGIMFLLLIPLPFVDVTSAWKFDSKFQRILTSAAGMMAEVFLAAIAAILWLQCEPGTLRTILGNLMVAASVHTLLFNANPLLRFDGYHMLADALEIPNLAKHASTWFHGLLKLLFLGLSPNPFQFHGFRGVIIRVYGIASFVWKTLLLVTLTLAAANLFSGIGLLLGVTASILWVAVPIVKFAKRVLVERREHLALDNRARMRLAISLTVVGSVCYCLSWLPAPTVINAPLVIDYRDLVVVRAESEGFIKQIHVQPGQEIEKGALLVSLVNRELQTQIRDLESQLQAALLRGRSRKKEGTIALWQLETEKIRQLQDQLGALRGRFEKLTVHAPEAGVVLANDLWNRRDTYCRVGEEILSLGREEAKEAIALVSQEDSEYLEPALHSDLTIRVWGHESLERGKLSELNPRSRNDLPHFAFAGIYGGPLEVVSRRSTDSTDNEQLDSQHSDPLKLVDSRIQVSVDLDRETSERLMSGQSGLLVLRGRAETLGDYITTGFSRWLKERILLNHGL